MNALSPALVSSAGVDLSGLNTDIRGSATIIDRNCWVPNYTLAKPDRSAIKDYSLEGAIQITRGRYFWPLEPNHPLNEWDIETHAQLLSTKARWNGVTVDRHGEPVIFNVAQHSVMLLRILRQIYRTALPKWDWDNDALPFLYGLVHDLSEAILTDVPRPLKALMGDYMPIEAALMSKVIEVYDVPMSIGIKQVVKIIDDALIFWERDELVGRPEIGYTNELDHPGGTLRDWFPDFRIWTPKEAKYEFLKEFYALKAAA